MLVLRMKLKQRQSGKPDHAPGSDQGSRAGTVSEDDRRTSLNKLSNGFDSSGRRSANTDGDSSSVRPRARTKSKPNSVEEIDNVPLREPLLDD